MQSVSQKDGIGVERVHNARHKNVTSALNTTFFKTSRLYFFCVCTPWFNSRITWINNIHLFSIVNGNSVLSFWWNGRKTGILFQNNDFVHEASVFITICLNDFFQSMYDTRLTSYLISFLINVAFCSIEVKLCVNVLSYFFLQDFYPCVSVKFVTEGHIVVRKWFNGRGDLAGWNFFHESQYTYYFWLGRSRNDNNLSLAVLC